VFALLNLPELGQGQTFDVNWLTIDGGAGTSTGLPYAATGTIGQADAGGMSGGSFSISGGFWGFLGSGGAVEPPLLSIRLAGTNAILAWPNPSAGFELQETPSLEGAGSVWNSVGQLPILAGNENR
jgi:hypothetical protein